MSAAQTYRCTRCGRTVRVTDQPEHFASACKAHGRLRKVALVKVPGFTSIYARGTHDSLIERDLADGYVIFREWVVCFDENGTATSEDHTDFDDDHPDLYVI
jgi:hypothetical protein